MWKKFIVIGFSLILATGCVGQPVVHKDSFYPWRDVNILDQAKVSKVVRLKYGSGYNQVGLDLSRKIHGYGNPYETQLGVTSFFVRDGVVYLLDRINKKMMVISGNNIKSIPLHNTGWPADIYVSEDKEIYILDLSTVGDQVLKIAEDGQVLAAYKIHEENGEYDRPDMLEMNSEKQIIASNRNQWGDGDSYNVMTGEITHKLRYFEDTSTTLEKGPLGFNAIKMTLKNGAESEELSTAIVPGYDRFDVLAITPHQFVEKATSKLTGDLLVVDRKGHVLGRASIFFLGAPINTLKVIDNHIYGMVPTAYSLVIYDIYPGFTSEKLDGILP